MAYLLDADVFIRAKRQHYGFDFCPAFWQWLLIAHNKEVVFSIKKVEDELKTGNDELTEWALQRGESFFLPPSQETVEALEQVAEWANGQDYTPQAVNTFMEDTADCYLVATALADGYTVVTHEVSEGSKNKIKIPDACKALGVNYLLPFDMLRNEQVRFILEAS